MVDREEIVNALHSVEDPELGMDIVELGLLYDAEVETMLARLGSDVAGHAFVDCRHLQDSLRELEAELTWDPPWTPERMSDDAKFILGFG